MRPTGVTVATFNLNLGADLRPLFGATGAEELAERTASIWSHVEASRPAERMALAARLLHRHVPDVVAIQEAALWRAGTTESPRTHDLLALLLHELDALGSPYAVAAEVVGFSSGELSAVLTQLTGQVVELADRGVILVRQDPAVSVAPRWAGAPGVQESGVYRTALTVEVASHPVTVRRGWCAVDVRVGNATLRVVATHLEAHDSRVRDAQAGELVSGVVSLRPPYPTVVLGDLNCLPPGVSCEASGHPTGRPGDAYHQLTGTGLRDAWLMASTEGERGGASCDSSGDLRTTKARMDHRVDMVLVDPAVAVTGATVLGAHADDHTPSGLRASDHGCVLAWLEV